MSFESYSHPSEICFHITPCTVFPNFLGRVCPNKAINFTTYLFKATQLLTSETQIRQK